MESHGTRLAAVKDNALTLWDSSSGKPLKSITLPAAPPEPSPGVPMAAPSLPESAPGIHLCDAFLTPVGSLSGHPEGINCLAWSSDSTRLASAGGDGCVKIRDIRHGRVLHTLSGHGAPVQGLAWNPAGTRIASGSWDMSLKLWDTATGVEHLHIRETRRHHPDDPSRGMEPGWQTHRRLRQRGHTSASSIARPAGSRIPEHPPPKPRPSARPPKSPRKSSARYCLYCEALEPHAGNDPDSLRRLAWIRATSPYAEVRDGRKAVQFAELANQVTGGRNTGMLSILAAAYAEAGDFEKAVATQQKAIALLIQTATPRPSTPPYSNSTNPANPSAIALGRINSFQFGKTPASVVFHSPAARGEAKR